MSIYCTYITFYRGNKLPPFYIGKSTIKNINNGYRGSVSSKEYKSIWISELKDSPNLFKTIILKKFIDKVECSKHEEYLQRKFNVHKNPMYINMNIAGVSFNLDQRFMNRTHHFYNSEFQTEVNMKQIRKGTHRFQNSNIQKENSRKQSEVMRKVNNDAPKNG